MVFSARLAVGKLWPSHRLINVQPRTPWPLPSLR
jgi:hypothetical protein